MINACLHFDAAMEQVKTELDRRLLTAPFPVRAYTAHLTLTHGKFIRARAVLACAMDGEKMVPADAAAFAVAIELLHLATLVHDDIMDEADLRRGVETLQKRYGKRTAVICGDYLLAAAMRSLAQVQENDRYRELDAYRYVNQICMGELRQNRNNRNFSLSMFRYLSIINGKTAALFEASCYAGALAQGRPPETAGIGMSGAGRPSDAAGIGSGAGRPLEAAGIGTPGTGRLPEAAGEKERLRLYRRFGRYLGIIFQLTDDCIDFESDNRTAGKNVQSDYEQGVVTLPVIYTFYRKPQLRQRARQGRLAVPELLRAVADSGGVSFTRRTAGRYYEKALAALLALALPPGQQEQLKALLDGAYLGLKKEPLKLVQTG